MESIYWVLSRDCDQECPHCYNDSGPGAAGLRPEQVNRCIGSLPEPGDVPVDRIILSGGEVLVWPELLFSALSGLYSRYGDSVKLIVQTNGDLLDGEMLDRLLAAHIYRVCVSSMDDYHPRATLRRREYLEELFRSRGMVEAGSIARGQDGLEVSKLPRVYAFWGATQDMWIGTLWPRGRARENNLSRASPEHRFCSDWSGAKGFLDYRESGCEVNIQLADVYPCCPMTCRPVGSLLEESLIGILDRCARHPVFRALNEGRPESMGEWLGISEESGFQRSKELGNHCLWCDEFFTIHAAELLHKGGTTERRLLELNVKGREVAR